MKFYYFAVGGIMLSLLTQSCSVEEIQCGDNGGQPVDCHNASGTYIGTFCTERDFPPCECYSTFGSSEKNNVDQFKYKDQCTTEGQYNFDGLPVTDPDPANPIGAPTADQPYEFTCALMGFDDICTEFEKNYFDLSQASHDRDTRPIYVQFAIKSLDLENFEYEVSVTNPSVPHGSNLTSFTLNETTLKSPQIRYFEVEDCPTIPCSAVINVRMDVQSITQYPVKSDVILTSIDRNSREIKRLATNQLGIGTESFNAIDRVFNLAIYKVDQLDMTQYKIGNRFFSNAILDVFSLGKSNIRLNVYEAEELPEKYMDNAGGEIILPDTYFSGGNIGEYETDFAIRRWCREVTRNVLMRRRNLSQSQPNFGFSTEINAITVVDPFNGKIDQTKSSIATQVMINDRFGATYSSNIYQDYYNSTILFRIANEVKYLNLTPSAQQQVTVDGLELATFLHEFGHMWSNLGYDEDAATSCLAHTVKCKGLNFYTCLWRTACVGSGSNPNSPTYDPNELSPEEFAVERIRRPTYCEGHQQIFMNSLRPLER